jgi:hypothetical protein
MAHWTQKVTNRRQFGELMLEHPDRIAAAKLLPEDFMVLVTEGTKAEEADHDQREQLTDGKVERGDRSAQAASLLERETELRSVCVAVVDDLLDSHPKPAAFLSKLSFARFRIRELAPQQPTEPGTTTIAPNAPTDGEAEEIRQLELVERGDKPARARGLELFCKALLKPGREPIVDQLARRQVTRQELEQLQADAHAYAEAGSNTLRQVEATKRESDAVLAQTRKWKAIRRLLPKAVKGHKELEAKLAEC